MGSTGKVSYMPQPLEFGTSGVSKIGLPKNVDDTKNDHFWPFFGTPPPGGGCRSASVPEFVSLPAEENNKTYENE